MSASHRFLHRAAALLSSAALAFGLSCASAIPAFADATAPCQLTDDQREAYEADGTLDQRLAHAEELGHDRPSLGAHRSSAPARVGRLPAGEFGAVQLGGRYAN